MDDKEEAIEKEEFDVVSGQPVEGVDEISKVASPFVIKTEPNDDYLITEGVDEIIQTISKAFIKAESKDNELPEVYGQMICQQPDQTVIKAESKDNELPEVYGQMISQQPDQTVIKAESKDNEIPEVYGQMNSQQPGQNVIKGEHLNDELPAVCENVICQPTLPIFIKTEPKDEEQHFGLLETLMHKNNLPDETPDSQPQVVIETKPPDELYGHEFSTEQICEVQSGECDVSTIPKRKKKSTVHNRSAEVKGQRIKPQNVSSHMGLHKQQCDICNRTFKFIRNLKMHMKSHDLKSHVALTRKTCEICHKTLASTYYSNHMRKHILFPFKCTRCARSFQSNDILESHRKDCERKKPLVCKICKMGFLLESSLREHFNALHNKYVYSCLFCSKLYKREKYLLDHTKKHTNPDKIKIKCPVCADTFLGMDCFNDHFETHGTAKDFVWCDFCKEHVLLSNYETHLQNLHKCQVCSKSFNRVELLRNHEAHCDSHVEGIYQCYICLNSFKTKELLNAHKSKHLEMKVFQCWICNKTVSSHGVLHVHFYTHKENLPIKCNLCGREFNRKRDKFVCGVCNKKCTTHNILHRHFYSHQENLPMKCNMCSREICWTDKSNYHIKRENFVCMVCNKKFTSHGTLHWHFYLHKENLPIKCNVCNREISWTDASNYYTKREKFVCRVCNKKVSTHNSLHSHFYSHKKNLPMKCDVCSREICWTDKSNYHIKIENFVCRVCNKKFTSHGRLHAHFYSHKENLPMKCNLCSRYKIRMPYSCKHCTKRFKYFRLIESHRCYPKLQVEIKCLGNSKILSTAGLLDDQTRDHLSNNNGLNLPTMNEPLLLKTSASNTLLKNVPILPTMSESNISRDNEINISAEHVISTASATCSTEVNVCSNTRANACNIPTISLGNIPSISADNMLLVRECNIPLVSANEVSNCNIPRVQAFNFSTVSAHNPSVSASIIPTLSTSNISTINEHNPLQNATSLSNVQSLNTAFYEKPMVHQPATSSQQINQKIDKDRGVQQENVDASCTSSVNECNLNKEQVHKNCGSELLYTCKVCQRMFKYPLDLKNHMKTHKKIKMNKLSFKC